MNQLVPITSATLPALVAVLSCPFYGVTPVC
jgi:hypothetical protein